MSAVFRVGDRVCWANAPHGPRGIVLEAPSRGDHRLVMVLVLWDEDSWTPSRAQMGWSPAGWMDSAYIQLEVP
jgi:hypothetical protein